MRVVDDLPFVPATCTQEYASCGSPSARHMRLMGSRDGSMPNFRAPPSAEIAMLYVSLRSMC